MFETITKHVRENSVVRFLLSHLIILLAALLICAVGFRSAFVIVRNDVLDSTMFAMTQAVSSVDNGLSVPDAGMLVRIAGALDTTVNDLLGEEEPEQGRDLAAELEALNRQLAEREERSRRRWRAFFAAVGILALWGAVMLAAGLIR